jgi:hypothetical protein
MNCSLKNRAFLIRESVFNKRVSERERGREGERERGREGERERERERDNDRSRDT